LENRYLLVRKESGFLLAGRLVLSRFVDIDKLRALLDDIEVAAITEQNSADGHNHAGNVHEALLTQGWANRLKQWARKLREALDTASP